MLNTDVSMPCIHLVALTAALESALPGKVYGVTHHDLNPQQLEGLVTLNLVDTATANDQSQATAIAAAHDPVFLSVDKTTITANASDVATITVQAPKNGAVTLLVNGQDLPVALNNGVGTDTIASLDPATITVSVKNPSNRSLDTLTITAR